MNIQDVHSQLCKAVLLNQFFDWIWYHRVVFIGVTTVIRKWIWSEFSKLLFHLMNELAMDLLQIAFILIFIEKDGRVVYTITSSNLSQEPLLHSKSTAILFPFLEKVFITNASLGQLVKPYSMLSVTIASSSSKITKRSAPMYRPVLMYHLPDWAGFGKATGEFWTLSNLKYRYFLGQGHLANNLANFKMAN